MPGTPPHAEHGSRAGPSSTDAADQHLLPDHHPEDSESSSKRPPSGLQARSQLSPGPFHLPSHISAFGEGSQEGPMLGMQPSDAPHNAVENPVRGQWNDHGFMDGSMAAKMGVPQGRMGQQANGHAVSESALSTDDDPQLQQLAEGMMVAAIDSTGSTAGPKQDNSIWQPTGQGSTSKPPGGRHKATTSPHSGWIANSVCSHASG